MFPSLVVAFATYAMAQSNLYPAVDPGKLAAAFNISIDCLQALNSTVSCDQTLLSMAGTVDDYLWDVDNVTALCTDDCMSSAQSWYNSVYDSCTDDVLVFLGREVPPYTIPGRTLDGMNIACLTPTTNVTNDPGTGGIVINGTMNGTSDGSSDDSILERRQSSSTSGYCLIDSYDWVGSDIIRPDCSLASNQNLSQCIDPTDVPAENERLANLYPDALLCDECFLKLFYLRLASPYLPDVDYSDYLILQYYDILDVCNKTDDEELYNLIVRETPDYPDAPGYIGGLPINTSSLQPFLDGGANLLPQANMNSTNNSVCTGQILTYSDVMTLVDEINASVNYTSLCDLLSVAFNVSSGDLYQGFASYSCDSIDVNDTSATWCVPKSCTIYRPSVDSTCDAVADEVSTNQHNITTQQLLQYNPNLQGPCDALWDQYLCITPPGGAYVPPPTNVTTTGDGGQERGGGDDGGSGTPVVGTGNPEVTLSAGGTPPLPTQSGIVAGCSVYSNASVGDTCALFAAEHNITTSQLYGWNSMLGTDGADCSTQFWSGYWYCVGDDGQSAPTATSSSSSYSSSSSSIPSSSSPPSPTQTGIVSSCDEYAQAKKGDACASFATRYAISPSLLYQWNTQLGPDGKDCDTAFWAGYYYCIHAPSASTSIPSPTPTSTYTSTSTSTTSIPSPTQSGIVANCQSYAITKAGDSCTSFAAANGISTADLYAWNSQLGVDGKDCDTELWSGYYYCVRA